MGIEVGSITTNPIASSEPIARDRILLKNFKGAQFPTPSGIGSGIKPTFLSPYPNYCLCGADGQTGQNALGILMSVGLAGFEPTTPCPPVKCRLFVAVRWCSFFFSVFEGAKAYEHRRTSAESAQAGEHLGEH